MTSWKTPRVMNANLIKKLVYFVYYDLHVSTSFCVYIYGASKQTEDSYIGRRQDVDFYFLIMADHFYILYIFVFVELQHKRIQAVVSGKLSQGSKNQQKQSSTNENDYDSIF